MRRREMEGRMERRNLTDSLMNLSLRSSSLYVTSGGHQTGQDIHSTEGHVPLESLRVEDGGNVVLLHVRELRSDTFLLGGR